MAKRSDKKPTSAGAKPGTERARDEQREGGGPRYAGGEWESADAREPDERFGITRADAADVTEAGRPRDLGELDQEQLEAEELGDEELAEADREVEGGGQREGSGRGAVTRSNVDRGGKGGTGRAGT
jgi:hypothetical protein